MQLIHYVQRDGRRWQRPEITQGSHHWQLWLLHIQSVSALCHSLWRRASRRQKRSNEPPSVARNSDRMGDLFRLHRHITRSRWQITHCQRFMWLNSIGVPTSTSDFGICREVLSASGKKDFPAIFGVCLGHQGIGEFFGFEVSQVSNSHYIHIRPKIRKIRI